MLEHFKIKIKVYTLLYDLSMSVESASTGESILEEIRKEIGFKETKWFGLLHQYVHKPF